MQREDLMAHVVATTGLTPAEAERVIGDVVAYFHEPVEDYVRRRHRSLQIHGVRGDTAYAMIAEELSGRVFAAKRLSLRQIRRIVYG